MPACKTAQNVLNFYVIVNRSVVAFRHAVVVNNLSGAAIILFGNVARVYKSFFRSKQTFLLKIVVQCLGILAHNPTFFFNFQSFICNEA